MDFGIKGKRALVTGSSSPGGIGEGICKALLLEGVDVVVHGRKPDKAREVAEGLKPYGNVAVALGELSTDEGADSTAQMALEAFGGIDILVNNAGGAYAGSPTGFFNIPVETWSLTHGMNVISAVNMIHRLTPGMQERKWGRIINMASFSAHSNLGNAAAYSTTKAAILNLTLGLAKTLKNTGITVNAVSPGMVMTDKLDVYFAAMAAKENITGPDWKEKTIAWMLTHMMPQTVARMGNSDDIGHLVAFLASNQAEFISAANMRVDGGASPSSN